VLDVKLQSVKDGFLVAWILFGTPSASGVLLVIGQYQNMSLQFMKVTHTIDPAIRSFSIQNVMSARTL
jgi:hypothetical protein